MAANKGAQKLRAYLADPEKIVVMPGVLDGLTARVALSVGFDGLYMVSPAKPSACVISACSTG
jgi:2-methylisocitrate lyase-like PEP mutase family enzyme